MMYRNKKSAIKTGIYAALLLIAAIAVAVGAVGCGGSAGSDRSGDGTQNNAAPGNAAPGNNTASNGGGDTSDIMAAVTPANVTGRPADDAFTESMADFSIELFKKGITDGENSLISPLSVTLALAMTANGADGETLAQMEALLGGDIPLDALNEYLYAYANGLPSSEKSTFHIANSIWFRDDEANVQVKPDFLQRNADYYGAAVFKAAFDDKTVRDINDWVKLNTDGMIEEILGEIKDEHMMYLINAIAFDAEWRIVYALENVREGVFTNIRGEKQNVDFMHSGEEIYLDDGRATGFAKLYAGGDYSFVALLPNEGVSVDEYVASLTGEGFLNTLGSAEQAKVVASMPKFEYEYEIDMNDALIALGMPDAFDQWNANFAPMATVQGGNVYIDSVLHKTFISVDELGTRAGAVTAVMMGATGADIDPPKVVNLDRPFVYAIVDNATNLPIFIGTLLTV